MLLSWSSGKDSAWALHLLRQQSDNELGCIKAVAFLDAEVKNTLNESKAEKRNRKKHGYPR